MATYNNVMGDVAFVYDRNSVAQDKVNLGYWFGNQELLIPFRLNNLSCILLNTEFSKGSIAKFRFRSSYTDYLLLLLTDSSYEQSSWIRANQLDEYVSRTPINLPRILDGKKSIRLCREAGKFLFYFEDELVSSYEADFLNKDLYFSIGSGIEDFYVDEVKILDQSGEIIFFDDFNFDRSYGLIALFSLLMSFIFIFLKRYAANIQLSLLALSICFSSYFLVDYFILSKKEPILITDNLSGKLLLSFINWKNKTFNLIPVLTKENFYRFYKHFYESKFIFNLIPLDPVKYRYSEMNYFGKQDSSNKLLFLATSQGSGEGATRSIFQIQNQMLTCFEVNFNNDVLLSSLAIKGGNAELIYKSLIDRKIKPNDYKGLIISLGNNDYLPGSFKPYFDKIIDWAFSNPDLKIYLAHEPASSEKPYLQNSEDHQLMIEYAKKHNNVFYISSLSISSLETFKSGDLWWDYIHMKNLGQRLYGKLLCQEALKSL